MKGYWMACKRSTIVAVIGLIVSLGIVTAKANARTADSSPAPIATATSEYAGSDTCMTCHEEIYKSGFSRTAHYKTTLGKNHGCESCHGPGAEHVAGGGDVTKIVSFSKLTKADVNTRCLSCHGERNDQRHFARSAHATNDVSCLDCHSPHHPKQPQRLLVNSQPQLCFGCHTSLKAEFSRPYRHRVNEGLVTCNDCHNVHGSTNAHELRNVGAGDTACAKCHMDKRGPFVYEHVPVKTEGCTGCHTAHGSSNPRLLRVSQVNMLCLQCHTSPTVSPSGPAHNQSQKYQACTMCHPAIHGSNSNQAFMK